MEKEITNGLRLTPYGGAGQVTGSNFLVEGARGKILVDCGVEQGKDYCESCSFDDFPYDVPSIDALVITHAHLDHVGRAPRLMRYGFAGKVYMTAPTRDLAELILRDSAHILAQNAQKHGLGALYDDRDIDAFLKLVELLKYGEEKEVAPGLSLVLRDTGHILGSASVRIKSEDGSTLAITSDIGASPAVLLPDAVPVTDADVVLIESVYGDRQNPEKEHRVPMLRDTLARAIKRGGTILMPSFSIERTQLMLYEIGNMMEKGELPTIPIYLDSPLAINVTSVYKKWGSEYFNKEAKQEITKDHDLFAFPFLKLTKEREESELIARVESPKLIIAGAGMSHGGRIGKWEKMYLPDPDTTLIMVGYQAPGSPGRMLQDGGRRVKIDGHDVRVRAKVEVLHGWSGHADRDGLVAYAEACLPRTKTFLVGLGEPASARFLAQRIHEFLGTRAIVLAKGEPLLITRQGVTREKE
jgi:metallo-beta-lactamase family protein